MEYRVTYHRLVHTLLTLSLLSLLSACSLIADFDPSEQQTPTDADSDADSDGDGDSDADADADGFQDADLLPVCEPPRNSVTCAGEAAAIADIAVGGSHTCVLFTNGEVYCLGQNMKGQSAISPSMADVTTLTHINLQECVVAISAGEAFSCALNILGQIHCWGDDALGQLGEGPDDISNSVPQQVASDECFYSMSSGRVHSCALTNRREAWCWGDDDSLQLGPHSLEANGRPVPIPDLTWTQVDAGYSHNCGIEELSGDVYCWGENQQGQLDGEQTEAVGSPIVIDVGLAQITGVAAGQFHSCAFSSGGAIICWGTNTEDGAELGDLERTGWDSHRPNRIVLDVGEVAPLALDIGVRSTYLLCIDGVRSWGLNASGQLGRGMDETPMAPGLIALGFDADSVAGGGEHACAWNESTAACWGSNEFSQLGETGTLDFVGQPVPFDVDLE